MEVKDELTELPPMVVVSSSAERPSSVAERPAGDEGEKDDGGSKVPPESEAPDVQSVSEDPPGQSGGCGAEKPVPAEESAEKPSPPAGEDGSAGKPAVAAPQEDLLDSDASSDDDESSLPSFRSVDSLGSKGERMAAPPPPTETMEERVELSAQAMEVEQLVAMITALTQATGRPTPTGLRAYSVQQLAGMYHDVAVLAGAPDLLRHPPAAERSQKDARRQPRATSAASGSQSTARSSGDAEARAASAKARGTLGSALQTPTAERPPVEETPGQASSSSTQWLSEATPLQPGAVTPARTYAQAVEARPCQYTDIRLQTQRDYAARAALGKKRAEEEKKIGVLKAKAKAHAVAQETPEKRILKEPRFKVSKALVTILRHETKPPLRKDQDGWASADDILQHPWMSHHDVTLEELIYTTHFPAEKTRFDFKCSADGEWRFRAIQGHSSPEVNPETAYPRVLMSDAERPRLLVHATYEENLASICATGIKPGGATAKQAGKRLMTHFADASGYDPYVCPPLTAMRFLRSGATAAVIVNAWAMMEDGFPVHRGTENVFLCPQVVPREYIVAAYRLKDRVPFPVGLGSYLRHGDPALTARTSQRYNPWSHMEGSWSGYRRITSPRRGSAETRAVSAPRGRSAPSLTPAGPEAARARPGSVHPVLPASAGTKRDLGGDPKTPGRQPVAAAVASVATEGTPAGQAAKKAKAPAPEPFGKSKAKAKAHSPTPKGKAKAKAAGKSKPQPTEKELQEQRWRRRLNNIIPRSGETIDEATARVHREVEAERRGEGDLMANPTRRAAKRFIQKELDRRGEYIPGMTIDPSDEKYQDILAEMNVIV
jgi:RNA:NAD 2'-phosphotransferase (TPT1/KptA family)